MNKLSPLNRGTKRRTNGPPVLACSLAFTVFSFAAFSAAFAQGTAPNDESLEATLQKLSQDAAISYIGPIVSGFGCDLNGGWFHKAPGAKIFGIDLEFGLVAMGTFFSDENKSFSTSGQFRFNEDQAKQMTQFVTSDPSIPVWARTGVQQNLVSQITNQYFSVGISGATVVGSKTDSVKIAFFGNTFNVSVPGYSNQVTVPAQNVTLPVGGLLENIPIFPLGAPQLGIGTIMGTKLTFRYLPNVKLNNEIGELSYFGFGFQHNPGIWFTNPLPLDVSIGFFTQTLDVGDILNTKTTAFGLNASKRLGLRMLNITPYAGVMVESSTVRVTYDYVVDTPTGTIPQAISFEVNGENKSRVTLGLCLRFLIFNLNADYNIGKYNSITGGLMLAL